jgi:CDGSH-type Zn-finger protein
MSGRPSIRVIAGGPMLVDGLSLQRLIGSHGGWTLEAVRGAGERYAVCRCGRSGSMPLCDRDAPYGCFEEATADGPQPGPFTWDLPDPTGSPALALKPNGPVRVAGHVEITFDGVPCDGRDRWSLCRCGASRCQPVCDSTHKVIGYRD